MAWQYLCEYLYVKHSLIQMNGSQNMASYGMIQGILGSGKDLLSLSMPDFNDDLKGNFNNDAKNSFGINKKLKDVGTPNVNDPASAYLGN